MSKKVKVIIGVLVAVLVMTFGGTAIAMADEEEETQPALTAEPGAVAGNLLTRVAEILDIPEEDLVNAFQQARGEMPQEMQNRFMERERRMQGQIDKTQEQNMKREQVKQRIQDRALNKAVRGRNMIAVPNGWQGQIPLQPAE
ncbi:hypothetical protein ACFLUB_01230 [Chloroflexota bacterium]